MHTSFEDNEKKQQWADKYGQIMNLNLKKTSIEKEII